jgi:DNA-binding response OmpR family regulator
MQKTPAILIVDDDPDIGNMLKMMLEFKGYRVSLLNRASETEKVLENGQFDLVILDMLIAGINGTDVCTRIRHHRQLCRIPVLMISALPDARKGCIDAGATDFISKPFEMNDLLAKVKRLV